MNDDSLEYLSEEQCKRLYTAMNELAEAVARRFRVDLEPSSPPQGAIDSLAFAWARDRLTQTVGPMLAKERDPTAVGGEILDLLRQIAEAHGFAYEKLVFELHSHLPFWQGKGHSRSGHGSTPETTRALRQALRPTLARLEVRSVLDAACGDWAWAREIDWTGVSYLGVDIVPDIVARNQALFGRPGVSFECKNILVDELPRADAILCRDCLFHLSLPQTLRALGRFARSGAKYLLTTTYHAGKNVDVATGSWYPINLMAPPFNFPPPVEEFEEGYQGKSFAVWTFPSLPALP